MSTSDQKSDRLLRFTMLVHRRKGMSEAEFHEYWTHKHESVVKDWLIKHGCVKYVQYHTPSSLRRQVSAKCEVFGNAPEADYDGAAEFYVRDGDDDFWSRAKADDYYAEVVQEDEKKFFDADSITMLVGWEELYIDRGSVVPSPGPNFVVE